MQTDINPNPTNWGQTLQRAVNQHTYIHREGTSYSVSRERAGKLSIDDIVHISASVLRESPPATKPQVEGYRVEVGPTEIKTLTEQLIDARVAKRSAAKTLAFVASFLLIGIPFYVKLKRGDQAFQNQIDGLRRALDTAAPQSTQSQSPARPERETAVTGTSNPEAERQRRINDLRAQYRAAETQVIIHK